MIVVWNPTAGRQRREVLRRVLDALARGGLKPELAKTRHAGHAAALAREAAASGVGLVVAAGGDGTIAEVASGLSDMAAISDGSAVADGFAARLGIIPLGTANVLAHELGLPFVPDAVAAALASGHTRPLWPGIAHGPAGMRLFVQMLSVGLDAQVVHRIPLRLKRVMGRGAYVWQTVQEAVRGPFLPVRVRLDGQEEFEAAGGVVVTKGRLYAGRYVLAPEACPTEPGFTVAMFGRGGPLAALVYGAALPLNLLSRSPGLRLLRAARIDIEGSSLPAQADGDPAGHTPIHIHDAPAPIHVVVG